MQSRPTSQPQQSPNSHAAAVTVPACTLHCPAGAVTVHSMALALTCIRTYWLGIMEREYPTKNRPEPSPADGKQGKQAVRQINIVYMRYLFGKGNLFGVRPSLQPVGYVAVMPYPACLRRTASPSTTVSVGVLGIAVGALVVATLWVLLCMLVEKVLCWL